MVGQTVPRLPLDHEMLAGATLVFLGQKDGLGLWAADISHAQLEGDDVESGFLDQSQQRHPAGPPDHWFAELRHIMADLPAEDITQAATARALFEWHRTHGFCANCGSKTEVTKAGWERSCPSCGRLHYPRVDPVAIMLVLHGNDVLLGRSPGWPEGMYSLLAGFVEPGETIEAAVRREVLEETGVTVGAVSYLQSQPWPFPSSLMFGCRGAATSREIAIDPQEIEDALWISREDMARAMAGQHPVVRPPRPGAIAGALLAQWVAGKVT